MHVLKQHESHCFLISHLKCTVGFQSSLITFLNFDQITQYY